MGRIRLLGLAAALLMSLAVSGCSTPGVCTAIAWSNTISIHLNGDAGQVAVVELCADDVCAAPAPIQQASDEPVQVTPLSPEELSTFSPSPTAIVLPFFISRVDERTWQVSVEMATPETLTLRALSATGTVLAERVVALEWRRVGGSEQCGGPSEAGTVYLDIPS